MRRTWIGIVALGAAVVGVGLLDAHLRGELITPEPEPPPPHEAPEVAPEPVPGPDETAAARPERKLTRAERRAAADADIPPPRSKDVLWLRVTVVDAEGRPVQGALIRSSAARGPLAPTRTSRAGVAFVEEIPDTGVRLEVLIGETVLRLSEGLYLDVRPPWGSDGVTLTVTDPLPTPALAALRVHVVDVDGQPVPGALIRSTTAQGHRTATRTSQAGTAYVPDVPSKGARLEVLVGSTVLNLGEDRYRDVTQPWTADGVTLTVTDPLAFVEATVTDALCGAPLAESAIELRAAGSTVLMQQGRTNAAGVVRFVVTPLLRYELRTWIPGAKHIVGPVLTGETARVQLRVRPKGSIIGTVTDADGKPVRWAWVWAIPATPPGLADLPWSDLAQKLGTTWRVRRAATDRTGRYAVNGLDVNGVYHVVAQVPHCLDSKIRLDVAVPRNAPTVNLTVPTTRPLTVVVFGKAGQTLKGTKVRMKTPGRGWVDAEHLGHGSYRFLGLPDGGHTLAVDAPGHALVSKYLVFPEDETEALRIDLR